MGVTTSSNSAVTYTTIGTTTGTGSSGTITFSSIPATYTDLILVANAACTSSQYNAYIRFNGDSTSGLYSRTVLTYDLSGVGSTRTTNQNEIVTTANGIITTSLTTHIMQISNYSNSNVFKIVLSKDGNTGFGVDATTGLWRNTNAINSVVYGIGGNFSTTSTFTLYGIKAA